jgi:hypothetical protein
MCLKKNKISQGESMAIIDVQYRTIKCDGPNCGNTVTFEPKHNQKVMAENPWLLTARVIQTGDGCNFVYCSDACEVAGIAKTHNMSE